MWIHLRNDEKRAALNLNFTLFFSVKGTDYKNTLKQIIEFYGYSVEEVDDWFKAAFEDFEATRKSHLIDRPDMSILQKNYEYFKKTYLPKEKIEINPIVKKINSYKAPKDSISGKVVIQQDDNTVVMAAGRLVLIYNNIDSISVEEQSGRLSSIDSVKKTISIMVDDSKKGYYLGTVKFNDLKNISITGYLQFNNQVFDVKPLLNFLDKKEIIDVSYNKNLYHHSALIFTQKNSVESTTLATTPTTTKIDDDAVIYDLESVVKTWY